MHTRIQSVFNFLKRVGFALLFCGVRANGQWYSDPVNPPQNLPHSYYGGLIPDSLGGAFLHAAQGVEPYVMYVRSDGDCSAIPYPGTALGGAGSINPGSYIVTSGNVFVSTVHHDWRLFGGPLDPIHLTAMDNQGEIVWDLEFPDTLTFPNEMIEGPNGSIWVLIFNLEEFPTPNQMFVQRIDANGTPEFGYMEIPLSSGIEEQGQLVQPDGEGGFWVVFEQGVQSNTEVRIQHFSANAEPLLPGDGVLVFEQEFVGILATSDSTVLSVRRDEVSGHTRYRRFSQNGSTAWDVEHPLAPTRNDIELPDYRAGLYLYRLQLSILSHLGASGEFNFLDMPLPYDISVSGSRYKFASDRYGRLNFLWLDRDEGRWYLQRYDSMGTALLGPPMLVLEHPNYTSGASFIQSMVCDKWGGTILGFHAWPEGDSLETGGWRFTRIDSAGNLGLDMGPRLPTLLPEQIALEVYPNPFNSTLSISLDVPLNQEVTLSLYDLLGREVDVVYRGRLSSSTISYVVPAALASGVYFLRGESGERSKLVKVVLLK